MAAAGRLLKRICQRPLLLSRPLSVTPKTLSADVVLFERRNNCAIITFNRPEALNCANLPMVRKTYSLLKELEADPGVGVILIKGSGVAFSAGADLAGLTPRGDTTVYYEKLFKEAYQAMLLTANLRTPYVALLNGITMGGGVGMSVHGRYRVATDKTLFSMPENAIGFFSDSGLSFALPRLQGSLGVFLGLSGHRLKGRDNYCAGIATHYVSTCELPYLHEEMCNLQNPSVDKVAALLDSYHEKCEDKEYRFSLQQNMDAINLIFAADTVEGILDGLEKEGSAWCKKQMEILRRMSPLSMKVSLEHLKQGATSSLKSVLEMDYRLALRFMEDSDLYEGVRALLVDRDNNPKWKSSCLEDVSDDIVSSYFARLPDGKELVLLE